MVLHNCIRLRLMLWRLLWLPVFLFVVDVCLIEKELQAVKDAVLMSFSLLPEDALWAMGTYLNDRAASIYAGTNEVQRNLIARAALDAF